MDCDMGGVPGEGGTEPEAWVTELERRRASRLDRLFRGVKLRVDDRECLAVVRDASPYGLRLRLYHGLPEHRRLAIELANGECHPLQLVWHNGDNAGVFFVEPIDYEAFLRALNERGVEFEERRFHPHRILSMVPDTVGSPTYAFERSSDSIAIAGCARDPSGTL